MQPVLYYNNIIGRPDFIIHGKLLLDMINVINFDISAAQMDIDVSVYYIMDVKRSALKLLKNNQEISNAQDTIGIRIQMNLYMYMLSALSVTCADAAIIMFGAKSSSMRLGKIYANHTVDQHVNKFIKWNDTIAEMGHLWNFRDLCENIKVHDIAVKPCTDNGFNRLYSILNKESQTRSINGYPSLSDNNKYILPQKIDTKYLSSTDTIFLDVETYNNKLFLIGIFDGRKYECIYSLKCNQEDLVKSLAEYILTHDVKRMFHYSPYDLQFLGNIPTIVDCIDLMNIFKKVLIKNVISYSLKNICKELFYHGHVRDIWNDDIQDRYHCSLIAEYISDPETLESIIQYNRVDCCVLYDLQQFLIKCYNGSVPAIFVG
jgi:uncharacterized protein YprB with RNaseH-like and TPR domain